MANVEALEIVRSHKQDETQGAEAGYSPTELSKLSLYSGWGGQADVFAEDLADRPSWAAAQERLRAAVSEEAYASMRRSTLTAFYTPAAVADVMAKALDELGVGRHGEASVLEPGCGTGQIIGALERAGIDAKVTGVELDGPSAELACALHPRQSIVNAALQDCYVSPDAWDAVVGNVPFDGDVRIDGLALHDYFIDKSIEAVRPGGAVCLLTSRYTMDKRDPSMRIAAAQQAELLCAFRLPAETFRDAGTDVVSDLLVLRRRAEPLGRREAEQEDWVQTGLLGDVRVNRLFLEHPELVVGDMGVEAGRFGATLGVHVGPGVPIADVLYAGVRARLTDHRDMLAAAPERPCGPVCSPKPKEAVVTRYSLGEDGTVWWTGQAGLEVVECRVRGDVDRLRGMVALRDAQEALLDLEGSPDSTAGQVERAIVAFRAAYSEFTESYGRICDARNQRAWGTRTDYSGAALSTIEETRRVGGKTEFLREGDVLSRRVLNPARPLPRGLTEPEAALDVALNVSGRVDLDVVAEVADLSGAREAREFLGELVIEDPGTGGLVEAEAYLSGDVRAKLDGVRKALEEARGDGPAEVRDAWLSEIGLSDTVDRLMDDAAEALSGFTGLDALADPDGAASAGLVYDQIEDALDNNKSAAAMRAMMIRLSGAGAAGADELTKHYFWLARLDEVGSPEAIATISTIMGNLAAAGALDEHFERIWRENDSLRKALRNIEMRLGREGAGTLAAFGIEKPDPIEPLRGETSFDFNMRREELELVRAADMARVPEAFEYAYVLAVAGGRGRDEAPSAQEFLDARAGFVDARRRAAAENRDDGAVARLEALERRLEDALPERVALGDISFEIGSSWMPAGTVMEFVEERLRPRTSSNTSHTRARLAVEHDVVRGKWAVTRPDFRCCAEAEDAYGSGTWDALKILECALNNTPIRREKSDPEGSGKKVPDADLTAESVRKRMKLQDDFVAWARSTPRVAERLERVYNERVNTIRPRSYDGRSLTLPGASSAIRLRAHQKDAVLRCLRAPEGTLIAHAVGAGKTFTGVAAAMEARRLGRAKKPLFAVPNALTEQWAADFIRLYPQSRVLYMTQQDTRNADATRAFWAKARLGDWDAVIVPQSKFDMLQLSSEAQERMLEDRLRELQEETDHVRDSAGGKRSFSVKAAEKERRKLEERVLALRGSKPELEGVSFDECGFDMLFVDEAHNYKNLAVTTGMEAAGVATTRSAKCELLYEKCMWLRSCGHGANIVFATGTPVSNTMSELYNLQRYVAPSMLRATGSLAFDSWASAFGKVEAVFEVLPEGGGFRTMQRFSKFRNLPELMAAFHEFADVLPPEDLDLDVPELEVESVKVEPSQTQKALMDSLVERAEIIRHGDPSQGGRKPLPTEDNMLCITNDGRKLALDPKLMVPELAPERRGKIQACAENVYGIWREGESDRLTQLVFCDSSTPNGESGRWNVVDDLKRRLCELADADGVGAEMRAELRSVWEVKDNQNRRQELFDQVQEGRVRIVIGSTPTLGTGVNVQRRLIATHDLDCPWRPSDLEQRQGRIERQGNMNPRVKIYRYVTEGSFDAYLYQTVERKQRFVSQVFTSKTLQRDADVTDDVAIGYAELKALATGDENIRRKLELDAEIERLEAERRAHAQGLDRMREKILLLGPVAKKGRAMADEYSADAAAMAELAQSMRERDHAMRYKERVEWSAAAVTAAQNASVSVRDNDTQALGKLAGGLRLAVNIREVNGIPVRRLAVVGRGTWPVGTSLPSPEAPTAWDQVMRLAENFMKNAEDAEARAQEVESELAAVQAAIARPWEQQGRYDSAREELAQVNRRIAEGAQGRREAGGTAAMPGESEAQSIVDRVSDLSLDGSDAAVEELAQMVRAGEMTLREAEAIIRCATVGRDQESADVMLEAARRLEQSLDDAPPEPPAYPVPALEERDAPKAPEGNEI